MNNEQMLSWMLYNAHWVDTSKNNPELLPYVHLINGESQIDEGVPEYVKSHKLYSQIMPRAFALFSTKIFIVSDTVITYLTKRYTKNNISYRHMPFNSIFIPTNIKFSNSLIKGIGLYDLTHVGNDIPFIKIIFIVKDKEGTALYTASLEKDYTLSENSVGVWGEEDKIITEEVRYLVCNILDFINNPEIELIHVEHSKDENIKRMNKGKVPIPICKYVRLNGKLKVYFDSLNAGNTFEYSHRFWVRGHFRTLRDEYRWGDNVGTKMWINPFVKGQGIFIKKEYEVKNE